MFKVFCSNIPDPAEVRASRVIAQGPRTLKPLSSGGIFTNLKWQVVVGSRSWHLLEARILFAYQFCWSS